MPPFDRPDVGGGTNYVNTLNAILHYVDEQQPTADELEATIHDIYVQALYDTIGDHRSLRTLNLEYAAEVALTG
ncbi:hypothetical protein [Halostagnicola bangensis]